MFQNKNIQKHLVMTLGGVIGVISIGAILTIAALDTTKEIPDNDIGTIGYALSKIIQGDWKNNSVVNQSKQLGGVNGEQFLRMTSTYGCSSDKVLARISPDGIQSSSDCVPLPSAKRPRPILATLRDLDSSCYTGNNIKISNPGYSSGGTTIPPRNFNPTSSDPIDLYEDDTIETAPGCLLASLYMPDHSIIRLSKNTTITLRYAGIPGGSGATSTDLDGGEMWARVLKPITDDSYFNVNTQEASVGVRGTSVYIKRESGGGLTVLPMDSGTLPDDKLTTGGVVNVISKGSAGTKSVRLNDRTTFSAVTSPSAASGHSHGEEHETRRLISTESTSTSDTYTYNDFIRRATLADLRDWDDLYRFDRGNLKTISMTGSWLIANSGAIQTGIGYTSNPQGIDKTEPKVLKEFTRTEPADQSEQQSICTNSKFGSNSVGCDITYYADYTIPGANKNMFKRGGYDHFDPQEPITPGHTGSLASIGIIPGGFDSRDALLEYPLAYKIDNQSGATLEVEIGNYIDGKGKYIGGNCFSYSQPGTTSNKTLFRRKIINNSCILSIGGDVITNNLSLKIQNSGALSIGRISLGETIRLFRIRK